MAEWPCTGLQIRLPRFDSGFRLQIITPHALISKLDARVVELVDTRDLKSLGVRAVPVQVRPGAPSSIGYDCSNKCDTSSVGRAQPCQG